MRVIPFLEACRANVLILDVYSCWGTEMSSLSFKSFFCWKPRVYFKVTDVGSCGNSEALQMEVDAFRGKALE